jgi:hypothetical protein
MSNLAYDLWRQDDEAQNKQAALEIAIELKQGQIEQVLKPADCIEELTEEVMQCEELEDVMKCAILANNPKLIWGFIETATREFMHKKSYELATKRIMEAL